MSHRPTQPTQRSASRRGGLTDTTGQSNRRATEPVHAISTSGGVESDGYEMVRRLCDVASRFIGARTAMLCVRDGGSTDLQISYVTLDGTAQTGADATRILLVEGSPAQRAMSTGQVLVGDRTDAEHALAAASPTEVSAFVFSPLVCAGEIMGLVVAGFEDDPTARRCLDDLHALALLSVAWLGRGATDARSLMAGTEAAMRDIAKLGPVAPQNAVYRVIVDAGHTMLGTDMIALFTIDPCLGGVECESTEAVDEGLRTTFWTLFGQRATDRSHECTWVVRDVGKELGADTQALRVFQDRGIHSIVACPVRSNVGASGVIVAFHKCKLVSAEDQVSLISMLGSVATAVISYALAAEQSACLLDDLAGANQRLSVQAAQDGLTGLPNHRAFQQRLADMCRRSTPSRSPFSLIMIDVDHFKLYNDSHGHQEGDAALRAVARAISKGLRQNDFAARYGGEEFALVLADTGKENALIVAERIRQTVANHTFPRGHLTISLGLAEFPADGATSSEIIEMADRALYHAKTTGRNRVVPWGTARPLHNDEPVDTSGDRKAVLLVEGRDADPAKRLRGVLPSDSYSVSVSEDLVAAAELLKTCAFDIVLVSETSPHLDGRHLGTLAAMGPSVPIVLVADEVSIGANREALRNGASDVFARPQDAAELAFIVEWNIERARVERRKLTQMSASVMLQAIEALVAAIDAKDPYTAGHSKGVTSIALSIADRLGITDEERYALDLAARLHDIGKLALPESALNKQSTLTEDEWQAMRQHPVVGAKIVGAIDELSYVSSIIRHHHERLDGSGYPDGLCDKAIPYLAKVIAVADAYEAMTAERAHRNRLTTAEAIDELRLHAGIYYDAEIVEVLAQQVTSAEDPSVERKHAA